MTNVTEDRTNGTTMTGNRHVCSGMKSITVRSKTGRVVHTSLLSVEDKIQSCFGSDIYLLVGLPVFCLPQLVLFGEWGDDIEDATVGILNIRLGPTFVTSVYTHNLAESLQEMKRSRV
jgi:hypothetical protein